MTENLEDPTNTGNLKTSKNEYLGLLVYLSLLSATLSSVASQALILDKSCRQHLNEKCDYLRDLNELNDLHRYLYSYYVENIQWISVLQYLLPSAILLFFGGWSDRTGRSKIILLLPVIGWTLQSVSGVINVLFLIELPLVLHIFLDTFLVSVFGGPSLLFLGLLNYVCNVTNVENRTYRILSISVTALSAIPLGLVLSNIMLRSTGYLSIYGLALVVNIINLFYIMFRVSDNDRNNEQMTYDNQGVIYFLKNFFNVTTTIKETIHVVGKKTVDSRMMHLFIYLFTITALFISTFGEISVMDVIVRYFYKWDKSMINTFFISYTFTTIVGSLLLVIVINKWLKWHESAIGIVSSACKILSAFVFCFVPTDLLFLIGPLVVMFNGGALVAAVSEYTKLLERDEVGKINSLVCLLWKVAMMMYMPMKFRVNGDTGYELENPHHLWRTMYLLGGAFALPPLFAFIWLLRKHRKAEKDNGDINNLIVK